LQVQSTSPHGKAGLCPSALLSLPTRTVSDLGERALIQRISARLTAPDWVIVGPGDDAAVVEPQRGTLDVLTTDAQVEGVHFDRRFMPPDAVGHRALAVNLSDLAAMGARPRAALLSLVLPAALEIDVVDGMLDGMLRVAGAHHVAIVGGNISRSPGPLVIDVTAIGAIGRRRILARGGARPGDIVCVTGSIGDGAVGLESLRAQAAMEACERRFLYPEARVRAGMLLARNRAATACMDLSDGLADGVRQIAEASNVGITLDAETLPVTDDVRGWHEARGRRPLEAAIAGGDDYELLFTVRPAHQGRLRAVRRLVGDLPVTRIGVVTKERALVVRYADGTRELPPGFEHFT
jgi:thiamine-monophosphate kinase